MDGGDTRRGRLGAGLRRLRGTARVASGFPAMTRNSTLATAAVILGLLAGASFGIGWDWQGLF